MLTYILSLLVLFFSTQLHGMESPFDINLDEDTRVEEEKSISAIPTLAQDQELLDATAKMLAAHEEFSRSYLKTAALAPLVHLTIVADISELEEWKRKLAPIAIHLGLSGEHGLSLQKKFDHKLAKENETTTHNACIASRITLTKQLAAYNQECRTCFQNLKTIFGHELKNVPFPNFLTIEEIKQKLSLINDDDPHEKLFFLCDYIDFLNKGAQTQINFFNCIESIHKILALPVARGTTPQNLEAYTKTNVLPFCTSQLSHLEKKILAAIQTKVQTMKNSNLKITSCNRHILEILRREGESIKKEAHEILAHAAQHKTLLSKPFLFRCQKYLSELEQQHDRVFKKLESTVSQNSHIPQKPIPVCKLEVMPHSPHSIQQLRLHYLQSMIFRIKHPIKELLGHTVSSVLYFFSRGSFITAGLQPTTNFTFQSQEQTHTLEQDTDVKESNEILFYAHDGNYYFINCASTQVKQAYKVDYVAALSFAKQQSAPAKIKP